MMKACIILSFLTLCSLGVRTQEANLKKSIFGLQLGLLELKAYHEASVMKSLRSMAIGSIIALFHPCYKFNNLIPIFRRPQRWFKIRLWLPLRECIIQ